MTITERAALEGLRLSCLSQLAKDNRRKVTREEASDIVKRASQAGLSYWEKSNIQSRLLYYPLFDALAQFLDLDIGLAKRHPNLIAGIAIDILNKEEEDGTKCD